MHSNQVNRDKLSNILFILLFGALIIFTITACNNTNKAHHEWWEILQISDYYFPIITHPGAEGITMEYVKTTNLQFEYFAQEDSTIIMKLDNPTRYTIWWDGWNRFVSSPDDWRRSGDSFNMLEFFDGDNWRIVPPRFHFYRQVPGIPPFNPHAISEPWFDVEQSFGQLHPGLYRVRMQVVLGSPTTYFWPQSTILHHIIGEFNIPLDN